MPPETQTTRSSQLSISPANQPPMVDGAAVQRLLALATMPLTVGSMAERLGADRQEVGAVLASLEREGKARPGSQGWVIASGSATPTAMARR